MIYGVGTDIIEIDRIAAVQAKRPRFLTKICTSRECEDCRRKGIETLAGKFAAKEAVAKALGCGLGAVHWQEIEICADEAGMPRVFCHGNARRQMAELGVIRIHVSISHCRGYATAVAVAETKEGDQCDY